MVDVKGLKELIKEVEEAPRGLMRLADAEDLLADAELEVVKDVDHLRGCPFCGADAVDSNTPYEDDDGPYIMGPHFKVGHNDRTAKVRFTVPAQMARATGFPVFTVGCDELIKAVAEIILGEDYEQPTSSYIGAGKSAEDRVNQIIEQLKDAKMLAHLFKED